LKNKLAVFGMVVVGLILVAALAGPFVIKKATGFEYDTQPGTNEARQSFPPFMAPDGSFSWTHPMGTDAFGRDMLARVLQGGRISLMVGIISTLVSLVIGITYGATAGYFGGKVDEVMMRIVDILYALPYMMIVIVLLAMFGGHSPLSQLLLLFVSLGAVSWLTMARIVRGQVLTLRRQEFVLAAELLGQSDGRILLRHVLPNVLGVVVVYGTLMVPSVIILESFLSFLGLGVALSWGQLVSDGVAVINPIRSYWWILLWPSLFLGATLLCLNFVGDGLRDALDPKARS